MLPKMASIMHYISTGSGVEELMSDVENKEYKLAEANKGIADLDRQLSVAEEQLTALKQKKEAVWEEMRNIEKEVRDQTWEVSQILEKVDVAVSGYGLSVKEIANKIGDTHGKVYVEFEGCVYRITGIYANGSKRILQVDKNAYVLADNKNGLAPAKDKNLSLCADIAGLNESIMRLRNILISNYWIG